MSCTNNEYETYIRHISRDSQTGSSSPITPELLTNAVAVSSNSANASQISGHTWEGLGIAVLLCIIMPSSKFCFEVLENARFVRFRVNNIKIILLCTCYIDHYYFKTWIFHALSFPFIHLLIRQASFRTMTGSMRTCVV